MRVRLMSATALTMLLALAACDSGEGGAGAGDGRADGVAAGELPAGAQAVSLLGEALYAPDQPAEVREVYLERYREAEDDLAASPDDADALIWMGRRTAYLGQFREAIDIYTHALGLHPDDARLHRHRGHRYVTVRELELAIRDFERGVEITRGQPDEVEPDGLPNERGIPTSTLQFNLWYHLGLAHYVRGDLEAAAEAYRSCLDVSVHPDSVVATSYWLYLTLRRLGRDQEARQVLAAIDEDMDIIESTAYLDLLLLFGGERRLEDLTGPAGGEVTLQSTTMAYGIGAWHLVEGRPDEAFDVWRRVVDGRNQWPAFGYLAAEAELARAG